MLICILSRSSKSKMRSSEDCRFHCPVDNCLYYTGSERYFKSKRQLDQHLLKVHAEKKFVCGKCSKGFPSDWQQKYHEKTCGIIWKCHCGQQYNCRETLLTHSRRTGHDLPSDVVLSKRKHVKVQQPLVVMPVAIVVQNISLPHQLDLKTKQTDFVTGITAPRKILPKNITVQSSLSKQLPESIAHKVNTFTQTDLKCCNCEHSTVDADYIRNNVTETKKERTARKQSVKNVAGTQTCKKCIVQRAMKSAKIPVQYESRGSQCSPRIRSQKLSVIREHTETQTTESVVGRMKKPGRMKTCSRAKRNLGNLLDHSREFPKTQTDQEAQSAWSSLDLILGTQWMPRCSSATQTSPRSSFYREMCDSQTLTDEMFPVLVDSGELNESNNCSLLQLDCSLPTGISRGTAFTRDAASTDISHSTSAIQKERSEDYPLFSYMYGDVYENAPALSHMETQTCEELGFDFLTNMETQTTNDFFSDLELSDIQTQTPWTDLLDLCENLDPCQLSAAIQTDITGQHFSVADDRFRKEFDFMDMQTQTHCNIVNAEFTNSYTQTLDLSSYFNLS